METRNGLPEQSVNEVKQSARRLRKQFLTYEEAEIVYSLSHKKLLELASKAGAIYRMDRIVLINRDIFDSYLELFREPPRVIDFNKPKKGKKDGR